LTGEGATGVVVGEVTIVVEMAALVDLQEVDQNMFVVDEETRIAEVQEEDTRIIEEVPFKEVIKDNGRRLPIPCSLRPRMRRTWLNQPM
jgi:hypothetical protein